MGRPKKFEGETKIVGFRVPVEKAKVFKENVYNLLPKLLEDDQIVPPKTQSEEILKTTLEQHTQSEEILKTAIEQFDKLFTELAKKPNRSTFETQLNKIEMNAIDKALEMIK